MPTTTTIGKGEPAKHVEGSLKLTQMGCPDCMLLFSSEEEMMGHFTLPPHQPPPFSQPNKCPVMTCDMNFPNRSKLILHMREGRHGQPCPQCGKSFPKVCYFNRQLISRKNVSFILIIHHNDSVCFHNLAPREAFSFCVKIVTISTQ